MILDASFVSSVLFNIAEEVINIIESTTSTYVQGYDRVDLYDIFRLF